jgi:hypothetical protein
MEVAASNTSVPTINPQAPSVEQLQGSSSASNWIPRTATELVVGFKSPLESPKDVESKRLRGVAMEWSVYSEHTK